MRRWETKDYDKWDNISDARTARFQNLLLQLKRHMDPASKLWVREAERSCFSPTYPVLHVPSGKSRHFSCAVRIATLQHRTQATTCVVGLENGSRTDQLIQWPHLSYHLECLRDCITLGSTVILIQTQITKIFGIEYILYICIVYFLGSF